ncbi:TetR/AcrR family transcriptional regulator [Nocardioides marmorisolisilvae]|nr:TetR/AcrR family transcriptional regulator [Nocardioides marmorisolisilvae]
MARAEVATRDQLIEAAARILAEEGLGGLSTRRLASSLGVSTMVVYTRFGSMPELMEAVVTEGFDRQAARLDAVAASADPAADLIALAVAYRANAVDNPHLYSIMYAANGESAHRAEQAKGTLDLLTAAAARTLDSGVGAETPGVLARQLWSTVHGLVSLELSGVADGEAGEHALRATLRRLISGKG